MENYEFGFECNPIANKNAVVCGERYRFTILTPRLIRIEYNERGCFLDKPTYTVINRCFDVPKYKVDMKGTHVRITTDFIRVDYNTSKAFSQESLSVCYLGSNTSLDAGRFLPAWRYGITNAGNLYGTTASLDNVDGTCTLEYGIMSRGPICVLKDENSAVFNEDGSLQEDTDRGIDQYLFCYGNSDGSNYEYLEALKDYYKLTGKTPMLPRYALGNWWCRYYAYTQQEYLDLMKRFQKEQVPLSVAMIDMDWHLTNINKKYGGGWTGFTWNKELFPDHVKFLEELHKEGLHIGLNTHPQGGVAAHEEAYKEIASAMEVDIEHEEKVDFNIWDKKFVKNYFEILHHPIEDEGVDFWWIDYNTKFRELEPDPLPALNHYHFIDNKRISDRPLILSRYAGPGSHRYPVGFSGDSVSSWDTLEFQPYFTATASNIGYGWWSHDIGGFQRGNRDDELIARWVQFGVFSPINRLHSMNSRYMSKEPWNYNIICENVIKKFMRLRHELIPYLYTMNYRFAEFSEPIIQPLYYKYKGAKAYSNKTEYLFGTQFIVSPIVRPHDKVTTYGSAKVYLPEGKWYDFFSNIRYEGQREFTAYRNIEQMPVFVKAGGIIPLAMPESINDINNPNKLKIKVFAGDSGKFEMYEDDGISNAYKNGKYACTRFELEWGSNAVFHISNAGSDRTILPKKRTYEIEIIGCEDCQVNICCDGVKQEAIKKYDNGIISLVIEDVYEEVGVTLEDTKLYSNNIMKWLDTFLAETSAEYFLKEAIFNNLSKKSNIKERLLYIGQNIEDNNLRLALQEIVMNE